MRLRSHRVDPQAQRRQRAIEHDRTLAFVDQPIAAQQPHLQRGEFGARIDETYGRNASRPPMYGRNTSGTLTDPSAF